MKVCSNCKEEKSLSEFNKNKSKKDGYQYYCKVCQALSTQKHYNKNKQVYKDNASKQKRILNEWFIEYKKTLECSKCGDTRYYCLDFHHTDRSTKEYTVSTIINDFGSKKKLIKEIEKCIPMCRNCHVELHHFESN